jgi:hypothetical protein
VILGRVPGEEDLALAPEKKNGFGTEGKDPPTWTLGPGWRRDDER